MYYILILLYDLQISFLHLFKNNGNEGKGDFVYIADN